MIYSFLQNGDSAVTVQFKNEISREVNAYVTSLCAEIEQAARSRLDRMMPELAKSAGATEELKAQDPMKWVGLMNSCKAQAEEIVKYELIYD